MITQRTRLGTKINTLVSEHDQNQLSRLRTSNVNDIETKGQTFRYRSLLAERKQNVLIWFAYYRNESKTF